MGRKAIYGQPMTMAERKARSTRAQKENIYSEALMALLHIAAARAESARIIGGTPTDEHLLQAMDALNRIKHMTRAKP